MGTVNTSVAIVGAGPVGLTLAIGLGRLGVPVTVIERKPEPAFLPKMERCNARTMEIFRRMGLADQVRSASKFRSIPMDVFIVRTLADPPLVQLRYPSVEESLRLTRACPDASMPREPYQLISQYTLEPLFKSIAERMPDVSIRYGAALESFEQDEHGVVATVRSTGSGEVTAIRSAYLVGCDGGSSPVRKALGIPLEGRGRLATVNQIFFRSRELFDRIKTGRGRHYYGPYGTIVVQDDLQHFMFNTSATYETDEDASTGLREFIGFDTDIEILHRSSWYQHLLVAQRYADRRVLLAGDSNHLYIPTGGLGMNTGIGDADNLAWKLAGVLAGWGGTRLLDSYDAERRVVGLRNCQAAGGAARALKRWRSAVRPEIFDETPHGEAARQDVATLAAQHQPLVHEMIGTELGYCYDRSPVIWQEDGEVPDPAPTTYVPSTWPGARLPHMWLSDGTSVHDHLGSDFTLLRLAGTDADTSALEKALDRRGVPFGVLTIADARVRKAYERDLILIRPDLHVVWRSNEPPSNPDRLVDVAIGNVDFDDG